MDARFLISDSDWARTNDLHPVKVALSQLSYGIVCKLINLLTRNNILLKTNKVNSLTINYLPDTETPPYSFHLRTT